MSRQPPSCTQILTSQPENCPDCGSELLRDHRVHDFGWFYHCPKCHVGLVDVDSDYWAEVIVNKTADGIIELIETP